MQGRSETAVAVRALYLYLAGMADLSHHQHVWECREPGCGALIPVLEGFGEGIVQFHRQAHAIEHLSAALAAERLAHARTQNTVTRLQEQLAAADQLDRERRKQISEIHGQLVKIQTAFGLAAGGLTVQLQ